MDNFVIVKRENGEQIKIEIVLSFKIEEYNKQYIAYTINNDNIQDDVPLLISEIDPVTQKIKNISENEKSIVLETYNQVKNSILNENEN